MFINGISKTCLACIYQLACLAGCPLQAEYGGEIHKITVKMVKTCIKKLIQNLNCRPNPSSF